MRQITRATTHSEDESTLFFPNLAKSQQIEHQRHPSPQRSLFISQIIPPPPMLLKQNRSESPKRSTQLNTPKPLQIQRLIYDNNLYLKRLFRISLLAVRAAIRLRKLQQNNPWKKSFNQLQQMKSLKLETTKELRIQGWCQGVLIKAMSSINQPIHNFVSQPRDTAKCDQALMKVSNAALFLFQSLALFTRPEYFQKELAQDMYSALFLKQRKRFSRFVSMRTQYLSEKNKSLPLEQQILIISEHVIMVHLVFNLFNTQQVDKFVIKVLGSLLQQYFIPHFYDMNKNDTNLQCITYKIDENNALSFVDDNSNDTNVVIMNLYDEEELQMLSGFKSNLKEQLLKYFNQTINNLIISLQSI